MAEIIIYNTEDGQANIKLYANDGTVWLNQAQIAKLFNTTKQNVSLHINNIFNEGELDQLSVVKDYLTTAKDGKEYNVVYYNLDVIIAKNYLTADEIDSLNRLVTIFLESAEFRVKQRKMLTMQFWRNSIDKLLDDHDVPVLKTKGAYTHEQAKEFAEMSYLEFHNRRKKYEAQLEICFADK